jgi:mevalonate kinase
LIRVHGKVILAGEHAVVRGHPAIVLPLQSRSLELSWEESGAFEADATPLGDAFRAAMDTATEILGTQKPRLRFRLKSDIPLKAGLGSSAALSAAISRFLLPSGNYEQHFPLALEIENLFHGRSSGLDVASALLGEPIVFRRGEAPQAIPGGFHASLLYLSDTGLRSSTKDCVEKVSRLQRSEIDQRMQAAVEKILSGGSLAEALSEAASCFSDWGLVPASVAGQMRALEKAGALAVKPTGSGDGGFLLSLWPRAVSHEGLFPL